MTTSSPQATIAAASNAKLTPAAPGWANVEGSRVLEDLFSALAQGGDPAELAAKADEQMNSRSTADAVDDHRPGRRKPPPRPGAPARQCRRPRRGGPMSSTPATRPARPSPEPRRHGAPRARVRRCPTSCWSPPSLALAVALGYPLVRQVMLSFQDFGLAQQFGRPPEWVGLDNYRELITDRTCGGSPCARWSSASSTRR